MKIGCVDVPNSSAIVFAVSPPMPFVRTTRSAASTISSFVNLYLGAIIAPSHQIINHTMQNVQYILDILSANAAIVKENVSGFTHT